MSCSSKRNRLVGSCISTFVSRTNSFVVGDGPVRAGLREGSKCRVEGAGRSLRSTMGLLEDFIGKPPLPGPLRVYCRPVSQRGTRGCDERCRAPYILWCKRHSALGLELHRPSRMRLSLIHISEPTRLLSI